MEDTDDVLRTKVLKEINEDFSDAQRINVALESNILTELIKCFKEEDTVIRELASRAVIQIAKTEKGREILIERKLIKDVS